MFIIPIIGPAYYCNSVRVFSLAEKKDFTKAKKIIQVQVSQWYRAVYSVHSKCSGCTQFSKGAVVHFTAL